MTTADSARRGRILLVEDDHEAAYFAVHVLTTRGHFDVIHTMDPRVALDRTRSERWDLVLTDLDLPGMTGLDLLAALVRHPGQTLSAEQLLELAWNDPFGVGPERVKFGVMRLRRKLGQPTSATRPIEAVRGFGYRYMAPIGD